MKQFPEAAAAVLKMLQEDLEADIAEDNAAVVVSNQSLATQLRKAIGVSSGSKTQVAKNLGIDVSAGREHLGHKSYQETQADQGGEGGKRLTVAEKRHHRFRES